MCFLCNILSSPCVPPEQHCPPHVSLCHCSASTPIGTTTRHLLRTDCCSTNNSHFASHQQRATFILCIQSGSMEWEGFGTNRHCILPIDALVSKAWHWSLQLPIHTTSNRFDNGGEEGHASMHLVTYTVLVGVEFSIRPTIQHLHPFSRLYTTRHDATRHAHTTGGRFHPHSTSWLFQASNNITTSLLNTTFQTPSDNTRKHSLITLSLWFMWIHALVQLPTTPHQHS